MTCGFHDVHLEIHSAIEAVELVHVVAEHLARRLGLDDEALHQTAIAVRESVMNAITHGNLNDPGKLVVVEFSAAPRMNPTNLIVVVRDQGGGFDPARIDDPRSPERVLDGSGRGIFLIRQFMDEVTMQLVPDGGMEVLMVKRLRG